MSSERAAEAALPEAPGAITRRAGVVAFFTMVSRVAGLVRDTLFGHFFGVTHATDAFLTAFTIPNTFRMLVAEGSLTVAFLPVFNDVQRKSGPLAAKRLMGQALAAFPLLSALLVAICMIFAEPLVRLYANGFEHVPGKPEETVRLTRWMFPFLCMVSFVALGMGALNARKRFAASAASPVVFNLVHTLSMVTLGMTVDPPMLGVAYGVLLGGIAQVLLQGEALRRADLLPMPRLELSPEVRRILGLMLPALVSLAIYQINIIVIRRFASYLEEGAVTYLYNADRFLQLPLGVFGIAVATASLPSLSDAHSEGDRQKLVDTFNHSLRLTNFVTIPSTVALAVLALPIMATVFQHGRFDHGMAQNTALALLAASVGLVAVSGIRVVAQVFFAMKDTRTPMACSAVGLFANLAAAPYLAMRHGFVGLALSVSLSAWLQLGVELVLLWRRAGPLGSRGLVIAALRDGFAAAVMGAAIYGTALLGRWQDGTSLRNVATLGLVIAVGALTYGAVELLLGSAEARTVAQGLLRRVRRPGAK